MTYDTHQRNRHRIERLRPLAPGAHPPLPIVPAHVAGLERAPAGPAPGNVVHVETPYAGVVPSVRRLDDSGRILVDQVASVLGWAPGTALSAATGPGHWATLRSEGRPAGPDDRRLAHLDAKGRVAVPKGIRTWLGATSGTELVVRIDAERDILQLGHASLLARALDALDRLEAAEHVGVASAMVAAVPPDPVLARDCAGGEIRHDALVSQPRGGRR